MYGRETTHAATGWEAVLRFDGHHPWEDSTRVEAILGMLDTVRENPAGGYQTSVSRPTALAVVGPIFRSHELTCIGERLTCL